MADPDYYIVKHPPVGQTNVDVLRQDRNWQAARAADAAWADSVEREVAAGTRTILLTRNDRAAAVIERDPGDAPPAGLALEGPFDAQQMRDRLANDAQWQSVAA